MKEGGIFVHVYWSTGGSFLRRLIRLVETLFSIYCQGGGVSGKKSGRDNAQQKCFEALLNSNQVDQYHSEFLLADDIQTTIELALHGCSCFKFVLPPEQFTTKTDSNQYLFWVIIDFISTPRNISRIRYQSNTTHIDSNRYEIWIYINHNQSQPSLTS